MSGILERNLYTLLSSAYPRNRGEGATRYACGHRWLVDFHGLVLVCGQSLVQMLGAAMERRWSRAPQEKGARIRFLDQMTTILLISMCIAKVLPNAVFDPVR